MGRKKEAFTGAAFDPGVHETLSSLEFNYLVALATEGDSYEACKKLGIDRTRGCGIFEQCIDLGLVSVDREKDEYWMSDELSSFLKKEKTRSSTKSIFGSPNAELVYRKLRSKYQYVFPEVPVCAFVERVGVEHLLEKKWKEYYFLSCRVDFLICTREGTPRGAVEYNGSYHEDFDDVREKDELKRQILDAAGLPLLEIGPQELRKFLESRITEGFI